MKHVMKKVVDGIAVLYPKGGFWGGEETDELYAALLAAFEDGNGRLVVNFHNTEHLNSTAIGALVAAYTHYTKRRGRICICQVGRIKMLLVIVHLVKVFDTYDTEEEALESFKGWAPPEVPEEIAATR